MNHNRSKIILLSFLLLLVFLFACTPETQTVEVTRVITETETITEQIEVTRVVEVAGEEQIITEQIEVTRVVEVEVPAAEERRFEGVEVDILTFVGPQVAEPLQRRAPDFNELTGATVNVITVPNSDLYQRALTDLATGTNSFDGFLFAPQWIVDFAPSGYLADLTDWVNADEELNWPDVAPFFRDFNSYEGRVYSIPLDGDFHMMYYRTDLFEEAGLEAPKTWDDYLEAAATFDGQDLNGDGEPDYGSCISKARAQQAYWWIYTIAAPYLQSQGSSQGAFFDLDTFDPLVNNDAFKRALEIYRDSTEYGPPDELNLGLGDIRGLFLSGRCALSLDWGDIGTLALDPANSSVQGMTGSSITPGSRQVLDRATGELVDCNEETCPFAIDGVNYAPYASFGGWAGAVNAGVDPAVQEATYAFFAYMASPAQANEDVTIGATGYNPYRISQFLNRQPWVEAGFSPEEAANYLGAIEDSLNSPNMVLDLRIPGNQQYQQVELDRILSQYLAGELDTDQAAQAIFDAWQAISEEQGRDAQHAAYLATIGASE
jgi:multiple sugar transport system substrate-binding protein